MTFDSAAWAINGPEISASLARRAQYTSARQGGVVQRDDLKVRPLATPGVGVIIADGVGVVLNGYQKTLSSGINEAYVVSNPGDHTIPPSSMPGASPADESWMVAIVVGDPDFGQTGHPWMTTPLAEGEETTFQYVRPTLIKVNAGATTLDVNYPALPLARIDIPANTTTITSSMIKDVRSLTVVRQEQQVFVSPPGTWNANDKIARIPAQSAFGDWGPGQFKPSVVVPEWARRAIVICSINGVRLSDVSANVQGRVRTQLGSVSGPETAFDYSTGGGSIRDNLQTAGEYDVTSIAGSSVFLRVEGYENIPGSPTNNQRLTLQGGSQMIFDVRFFEE